MRALSKRLLAFALMLGGAACAGETSYTPGNDAGTSSDAGCGIAIIFDPADPVASPVLPIRAYTNVTSAFGYNWAVRTSAGVLVPTTPQAADGSQINFIAANPGYYEVTVDITGSAMACTHAQSFLNVEAPNATTSVHRMRMVPAPSVAPPYETLITVRGGADAYRSFTIDPGSVLNGSVRDNTSTGIPAYLKFMSMTPPNPVVGELFSQANGNYSSRLPTALQLNVLVVPTSASLAPKLASWSLSTTTLSVGPGTLVSGTVRGPGGTGLVGAKVQLYAGIVPSTIATTAGNGSFSVRTDFGTNANVTVKVTPPATSGLPRIEGTAQFNLAQAMQIDYASALATCDLANTPIQRIGANQPNAKVIVVGTMTGVATITAGTTMINAPGTVRVAATADGTGKLPTTLVPRAVLSAVTELSQTDHAVSGLDTSTCPSLIIDAPPITNVAGTARDGAAATLLGVQVEATPVGPLALAGTMPVQATAGASGDFSLPLATGGRYDVRFADPFARAAPLVVLNETPGGVPTLATLPKALTISGDIGLTTGGNAVIGASIQILCAICTGLDAARPIAETATNTAGHFRIAVPDPGTM